MNSPPGSDMALLLQTSHRVPTVVQMSGQRRTFCRFTVVHRGLPASISSQVGDLLAMARLPIDRTDSRRHERRHPKYPILLSSDGTDKSLGEPFCLYVPPYVTHFYDWAFCTL
jgi:hypothetical protein